MTAPDRTQTGSPLLWRLVGLAVRTFYRVDRVGPSVPDGALMLVANPPNTLLDPSVIQATAGRPVRFLAKSTLFQGPFLGAIIKRSGAIPVYRKMDPGADTSRNIEMFAAVQQALADKHAICLFPEGVSHVSGHLEPLRTGAARGAHQRRGRTPRHRCAGRAQLRPAPDVQVPRRRHVWPTVRRGGPRELL